METELIYQGLSNSTNKIKSHEEVIISGLKSANQIFICTAFLTEKGVSLLKESLMEALRHEAKVTFIVGLDDCVTQPKALLEVFRMFSKYENAELLLVKNDNASIFHPKLYFWIKGNIAFIVIGSANLTGGGLSGNIELSAFHEISATSPLARKIMEFLSHIRNNERILKADKSNLRSYEEKYEICSKARQQAANAAKNNIGLLSAFENIEFQRLLDEYRSSEKVQNDWQNKCEQYKKAGEILNVIASGVDSGASFSYLYEQLVGAAHKDSLWHSGRLYRSKSMVLSSWEEFEAMVKSIREKLDNKKKFDAAKIFYDALEKARKIKGVGPNIVTEILNTYRPEIFAPLNSRPIITLKYLGCLEKFGSLDKNSLTSSKYDQFNSLVTELAHKCKLENLSQADHFLNFIFEREKLGRRKP